MRPLRVLIVNHCHPATPHVCGTRAREFAHALSRRGHRVVLLTESLAPDAPAPAPRMVAARLDGHDWSQPFLLAPPPLGQPLAARARRGALPPVLGKAAIALAYLSTGGVFGDWVAGTRACWPVVARAFAPDIAWSTFGNTGAWIIARGIAAAAGCPWVMDLKDSWTGFVPAGLRLITARRFGDARAATALSAALAEEAAQWFGAAATVVYSGVPAAFADPPFPEPADGGFTITLSGSIYRPAALAVLVDGLGAWLRHDLDEAARRRVRLAYYGGDGAAVRDAAAPLAGLCTVDIAGFRPLAEYFAALQAARLNVYVQSASGPSHHHHKVIELFAARRPVLCVPGAGPEARAIGAELGAALYAAADAAQLRGVLARVSTESDAPVMPADRLARYSWDAQAATLERVLSAAAQRRR